MIGIGSTIPRLAVTGGAGSTPASIFGPDDEWVWLDPNTAYAYQDTSGTVPSEIGDPVGLIIDRSGNGYDAVRVTNDDYRVTLVRADNGDLLFQNDEIDDEMQITFPDLGTECTVAYVTQSEIRLLEDQTLNGSYTLPQHDLLGFVAVDRAMTKVEKIRLIRYLASKAQGVRYGADLDDMQLACINAVDVLIYDASLDSDGGAWAVGAYPALMVIVAETASVKVYDGADPSLPLHTTLDFTGYTVTSVAAVAGVLSVGTSTGLAVLNLADSDTTVALDYTTATVPAIVNNVVNDVAMAVLHDAPVDPATGLPVPTIAVATGGNGTYSTSVITDDGSVYNIASDSTGTSVSASIDGTALAVVRSDGTVYVWDDIGAIVSDGASADATYSAATVPYLRGTVSETVNKNFASSTGLSVLVEDTTAPASGMVAHITSSWNSGYQNGDIKGAFLADTDDTDLVGGTDADRSVNGNDLTVNGTITRSPVATGAELVAYSGFSASNYLEQPYNSDLDFGTGDFCVMGWVKFNGTSNCGIAARGVSGSISGMIALSTANTNNTIRFDIGSLILFSASTVGSSSWAFVVGKRESGIAYLYLNGTLSNSGASTQQTTNASATTKLGQLSFVNSPLLGSLALWRISATAPSAEQIAKIYEDELPLFQENAACTLYGASDAVTALAHDPGTDLLHVGTSAGRSVFRGLERIQNTTTSVSKAISAVNGLIAEK